MASLSEAYSRFYGLLTFLSMLTVAIQYAALLTSAAFMGRSPVSSSCYCSLEGKILS